MSDAERLRDAETQRLFDALICAATTDEVLGLPDGGMENIEREIRESVTAKATAYGARERAIGRAEGLREAHNDLERYVIDQNIARGINARVITDYLWGSKRRAWKAERDLGITSEGEG